MINFITAIATIIGCAIMVAILMVFIIFFFAVMAIWWGIIKEKSTKSKLES